LGFSKTTYEPEVAIIVNHPLYPDSPFTFFFPKKMPQEAIDASTRFLGLKEDVREEESDKAFVEMLTAQMSRPPEGFDDLEIPKGFSSHEEQLKAMRQALIEYFYDPSKPELSAMLLQAKRKYTEVMTPRGYLKSRENNDARDDTASGTTQEASSVV
jgi:hypothetical protein